MAATAEDMRSVESLSDYGDKPADIARRWLTEIQLAKKDREKWCKQVRKIVKRYRDERSEGDETCKFNILWSNVQTLGPAIYAKAPEPVVERRFLDRDPVGRVAARILERTLKYQIEAGKFHPALKLVRLDYLLAGQGVNWIRYEPTYKDDDDKLSDVDHEAESPDAEPYKDEVDGGEVSEEAVESYPDVIAEKTCVDYIHSEDYLTSPARTQDEITWKAKRAFLTRDQLKKRFKRHLKATQIKEIPLDHKPSSMSSEDAAKPENELLLKATVWEIWDKPSRQVIFIAEGYSEAPLQVADDPLKLECFWPTPDPCMATTTNDTVVPVPDYHEYADQAKELDDLTTRIALLTDAIRASGVYDSSVPELARLLEEGGENVLYPVDQWAAFAEKGGILGAVSFLPIKEMAEVLIRLYEARQQVKNDLYEITGISDIVRGMSSGGTKTATEQRIKGQFANLRLSDRQDEMARFARDTLAIMAEIIAELFSPETIWQMSGYEQWGLEDHLPPDMPEQPQAPPMGHNGGPPMEGQQLPQMPPQAPQQPMQAGPVPMAPPPPDPMEIARQKAKEQFDAAVQLLRNDKLRGFRIDVETDSTIEPDQQMEKEARVEFLQAASQFLNQSVQVGQLAPEMIPLLGKMLLFGVRGFRAGRELETAFEETLAKVEKAAAQPKEPQKSPEQIKGELEQQKMQMQMQFDEKKMAMEAQKQQAEDARQAQIDQMDMAIKREEFQMKKDEMMRNAQIAILKHTLEMEKMQASVAIEGQKMEMQSESMQQKQAFEAQNMERKAEYDDRAAERQAQSDERKAQLAEDAMKAKAAAVKNGASKSE